MGTEKAHANWFVVRKTLGYNRFKNCTPSMTMADHELETGGNVGTVLLIASYFPPGTSSGTMRTVKFAKYLPEFGWNPQVLTMSPEAYNPKRFDFSLVSGLDPQLKVHRTAVWMPDRALARLYKRIRNFGGSPAITGNDGAGKAGAQQARKRRWLVSDFLDWMHFPDDYGGWLIPGILEGRKLLRREHVDVLYSTAPSPVAHLIAMGLKRITGLPWIADFRDPWEVLFPECIYVEGENRMKRVAEIAVGELAVGAADLVIANTDLACEAFQKRFPRLPTEKFVTLPNGFDPVDFEDAQPTESEGAKLTVTYAGTFFADLRTPDETLQAVNELVQEGRINPARFALKFVGCGPVSAPQTPTLEIIPRVAYLDSLRIMGQSDVLLLLQQSEKYRLQIPAKTYEYMAVRKWILALAPDGSTAELVRRMPNGVVVAPGRKEDLKSALSKFYRMFLEKKLYPVPQDEALARAFTRREQTRTLGNWLRQVGKRQTETV